MSAKEIALIFTLFTILMVPLNFLGGKLADKLPRFMKTQVFLDVLCLVIILFIIYLAFRFDFWRFLA